MKNNIKNKKGGFSLIGLIVLIVIIFLLLKYNHLTITEIFNNPGLYFSKVIDWFKNLFNSVK